MAIAEQTTMVQTVLAARGYRLEVLTRLVESPVDYVAAHCNACYRRVSR